MKNRKIFSILIVLYIIITAYNLSAQQAYDPNDRIYKYLTMWHEKGYIKRMPIIRPYSIQAIVSMLEEVRSNGNHESKTLAAGFLKSCKEPNFEFAPGKGFPGPIHLEMEEQLIWDLDKYTGKSSMQLVANGLISDLASYSGKVALSLLDNNEGLEIPAWSRFFDEANSGGGVVEGEGRNLAFGHFGLAGVFFGTRDLIFQAGLMRTSFGPFFENGPVITPEAPAAGHFSFTWEGSWYSFSTLMLDLYAKYRVTGNTGVKTALAGSNGKYLFIHNARFYFTNWLNFGVVQTNMTGGAFNPVYLVPLQHAFFTQQLYGDGASSILGFYGQFDLPWDLQLNGIMYVDDWDAFSSSAKTDVNGFNLNSAQNKFAMQAGISWSPVYQVLKRLNLSYMMITPYMYTHSSFSPTGYLTYTHTGENLGTILEPNSDQVRFNALITPFSWWDIDLWAKYTRHGNGSEGFEEDGVISDGTVFDDGFTSAREVTFYGEGRFLTQSVIEKVLQVGVDMDVRVPVFFTEVGLSLGYMFQYVWDAGLVAGEDESKQYVSCEIKIAL